MQEVEVASTGYRAFISYSHKDATLAHKLHRRLERYAIPARLIGTQTTRGPVPARLTPIFRDQDELPASDDLNGEIKGALAGSGALIVICSPDARASRWVNREIELFRDMHGTTRPILAVLASGEPGDAFPEQLLAGGAEPVAADFRRNGDGQSLALLKLVAGLTGASLDKLVQRDAQARVRRVMAVTVMAVVAMLIMAALLVAALRARSEADRQRAEAEGLVEYMLTDLRDRLKGVGRVDVMMAVNDRAMSYYNDQQALDRLPPGSLARRARILHAMGEDDDTRGDFAKSLAKFREAHRATAAALAQQPGSADAVFAHAQSEYWAGYASDQLEDRAATERHWSAYLVQANRLAQLAPGTVRALMELGYANGNLCAFYQLLPETRAKAAIFCAASVRHEEAALAKAPEDRTIMAALANRLGWNATLDLKENRPDAALANRTREQQLLGTLVRLEPANAEYQNRRIWNTIGTASALSASGRQMEAARTAAQGGQQVRMLMQVSGRTPKLVELLLKSQVVEATALKQARSPALPAVLAAARVTLKEFSRADAVGGTAERYARSIASMEEGGTE